MYTEAPRRPPLLPFILAASLLHALLLTQLRAPTPLHPKRADRLNIVFETVHPAPTVSSPEQAAPSRSAPVTAPTTPAHEMPRTGMIAIDPDQLQRSIGEIARDEGVRSEQDRKAREEKLADTPLARLQQAMRQPHSETHMQDGIVKLTTSAGTEVCYRPVPHFAREAAGLYAIPTTCP